VAQAHKDYTGTPLPKKLGIREGSRVLIVNAPEGFEERLEPLPQEAGFVARGSAGLGVIVLFSSRQADLDRRFSRLAGSLDPAGRLWIAWPKKASRVQTDITFESAQGTGLGAGLVDNKSASITDEYQGLQFVYRLKDRPKD
jgi:hypothetical protein